MSAAPPGRSPLHGAAGDRCSADLVPSGAGGLDAILATRRRLASRLAASADARATRRSCSKILAQGGGYPVPAAGYRRLTSRGPIGPRPLLGGEGTSLTSRRLRHRRGRSCRRRHPSRHPSCPRRRRCRDRNCLVGVVILGVAGTWFVVAVLRLPVVVVRVVVRPVVVRDGVVVRRRCPREPARRHSGYRWRARPRRRGPSRRRWTSSQASRSVPPAESSEPATRARRERRAAPRASSARATTMILLNGNTASSLASCY